MEAVVWVTGNVGSEVEVKEPREGLTYASFRLACTPRQWRNGQWGDEETTWLGVVCRQVLAQHVRDSIHKGDPVVVVGRLRTERWDGTDGSRHERLTLNAQAVGHDLSRGTAEFRKAVRVAPEEPVDVNLGELILATEAQDDDVEDDREPAVAGSLA